MEKLLLTSSAERGNSSTDERAKGGNSGGTLKKDETEGRSNGKDSRLVTPHETNDPTADLTNQRNISLGLEMRIHEKVN